MASTICPTALALVSFSQNNQIVRGSGTRSPETAEGHAVYELGPIVREIYGTKHNLFSEALPLRLTLGCRND
ncbi:MAG: hypothetical protein FJX40_14050 [Alphaproteobacteria bacterium]|nr:hypothetical protein [Alphaproteobacteria bacterium]